MTGASAKLRASLTGDCPAQRISDKNAGRVTDIVHRSALIEHGRATCHRCGRVVGVTRRFDDGRWGWSPWRYDSHKPSTDRDIRHEFLPVAGHPDDDECTYREDGTDATYCGESRDAHATDREDGSGHAL